MRVQRPLAVVTPTLDGDVLTVLSRAHAQFTVGDVQRMVPGRSAEGIRKTLARLVEEGVVSAEVVGRTRSYSLNREHLAAPAIATLANLETELLSRLRYTLEGWQEPPVYAAIFGSAARGEMRSESDIDILLIKADDGNADLFQSQVSAMASAVTKWTGNDTRPLIYEESEVGFGVPVLDDVVSDGKTIVGEPGWLRRKLVSAK